MNIYEFSNTEIKSINVEDRTIEAVVSTEQKDRDGDIVLSENWDIKEFKDNPILLWKHNLGLGHDGLPIGKILSLTPILENGIKSMKAKIYFSEDQFADRVFKQYQEGVLKGFSIGMMDVQRDRMNPMVIASLKLIEISAVPIPSNPGAIAKELISEDMKDLCEEGSIFLSLRRVEKGLESIRNIQKHYEKEEKDIPIKEGDYQPIIKLLEEIGWKQFEQETSEEIVPPQEVREETSEENEITETSDDKKELAEYMQITKQLVETIANIKANQKQTIIEEIENLRKSYVGR